MQKQRTSGAKPHKRTSGSFNKPACAPLPQNRPSHPNRTPNHSYSPNHSRPTNPKRDSVPLAEHPYVRSSSAIYSGGERTIFRKQNAMRRNALVLCIMGGICIVMAAVLIGFTLGKDAGLAEAGTGDAHFDAAKPAALAQDAPSGVPSPE